MASASTLRFSVALCTYNGEPWIAEQLRSVAEQSLPPAELVVCDDRSSDRTVEIVEGFARTAHFPVRVFVNETNIGSSKNFERAIERCEGEIVALCDQDDVWLPHKLARTAELFARSPDVGMVFTDARMVDAELRPFKRTLWESVGFGPGPRRSFARGSAVNLLLNRNVVTGTTMAFRSSFRDLVVPIQPPWVHDGWIALVLSAVTRFGMIDEPTMLYRIHPEQQLGVPDSLQHHTLREWVALTTARGADDYLVLAGPLADVVRRLESRGDRFRPHPGAMGRIAWKIHHLERRSRVQRGGWSSLGIIATEFAAGRYHRYSKGFRSAARDLVMGPGGPLVARARDRMARARGY